MNILEQLQQIDLSKEEVEAVLDNIGWTVDQYDKSIKSFQDALNAFDTLKDNKIVDMGMVDIPSIEKAYFDYKAEFTEKCNLLREAVDKLTLLKEIL